METRHQSAATAASPGALAQRHFDLGVAHQAAGRRGPAQAAFELTLLHWPGCAAAWSNLGLLAEDERALPQALACYEQALALDPALFSATLNLANVLARLKRFDDAERAYGQAIRLRPDSAVAWSNLGAMLACVRRDADALACCGHALMLDPGHAKARFNLSYPLLRQGRLEEGFACNEARDSAIELQREIDGPRWAGEDLAGRRLLLVSDAGHGDALQMVRYVRGLKERGAGAVIFYGQSALRRLFEEQGVFDGVLAFGEPLSSASWDLWSPLMSLPFLCRTGLDSIPGRLPYLRTDATRRASWQARLQRGVGAGELRVGLVWRGNPGHESDADRSLPHLRTLAPLGQVPGVRFVSLQSGAGAQDVQQAPPGLAPVPLDAGLGDFAETAALVVSLDLVIGVDTSIVHLAGALGVTVWVLLADYKTDWRWLEGRDDSPWYPGVMRLFRQRQAGHWDSVVAEVAAALSMQVTARADALAA